MLFAGTVWHAAHQGRFALVELGWTCVYGLVLEWLTLRVLHAYHYGQFLIMIDNTPLCIGLGWGIIIDSSMRFANRFQLAEPIRPIAAALMGLSIDLAIDVMAIRVGLWQWTGVKFNQQWFGVPWANFGAWFMVIWSYSGFIWALRSWAGRPWREWLYAPVALVLSLIVLTSASALYPAMSASISSGLAPVALIIGSLGLVVCSKPHIEHGHRQVPIVVLVPLGFHVFAILVGISDRVFVQQPILVAVELLVFTLSLGVHGLALWGSRQPKWHAIEIKT